MNTRAGIPGEEAQPSRGEAERPADNGSQADFFRQVFAGSWITQAIAVAAELRIADLLAGRSQTAGELAALTETHADALYRILRALASVGLFTEDDRKRFSLTPLAEALRGDATLSHRAWAMMMGAEFQSAWGELLHSARTGEPGFEKRFGQPFFQYLLSHPERHRVYDAAIAFVHGAETAGILSHCGFERYRTVVDVGGGAGHLLAALLQRHPGVQGILFDLPAVAERARSVIRASGLEDRCRVEEGDFFQAVPRGADGYLLRHVLHDWQDADATRILRNCCDAMSDGGRVLVVEMLIRPGNAPAFSKWLDLMMLLVGGRERTGAEYSALFAAAGLKLARVIPSDPEVCILEGVRA